MLLPDVLGAPQLCQVAGKWFPIRPMSLEGYAILMVWLDQQLPGERERYPDIGAPESQAILDSWWGVVLRTWLALREHGVTFQECIDTYAYHEETAHLEHENPEQARRDHEALMAALQRRRKTMPDEIAGGRDISRFWCDEGTAAVVQWVGMEATAKLSIDQYEFIGSAGKIDELQQWSKSELREAQDKLPGLVAAWEKQTAEEAAREEAQNAELVADMERLYLLVKQSEEEVNGS